MWMDSWITRNNVRSEDRSLYDWHVTGQVGLASTLPLNLDYYRPTQSLINAVDAHLPCLKRPAAMVNLPAGLQGSAYRIQSEK